MSTPTTNPDATIQTAYVAIQRRIKRLGLDATTLELGVEGFTVGGALWVARVGRLEGASSAGPLGALASLSQFLTAWERSQAKAAKRATR